MPEFGNTSNTNILILSLLLNALNFTIIFALDAKRGCEPPKVTTALRNKTDYLPPWHERFARIRAPGVYYRSYFISIYEFFQWKS
jgi:hypothetical protein